RGALMRDETAQQRACQPLEIRCNAEAKLSPAQARRRCLGRLRDLFEGPADRGQVVARLGRERDGPRRTMKQLQVERGLQRLHELTDRARRHAELVGGGLEAHVTRRRFEGAQAVEGWQAIGHGPSLELGAARVSIRISKPRCRFLPDEESGKTTKPPWRAAD